eukprot:SM000201S05928  [mRNA]  locus=s201:91467:95419:+ [translate_table: standard]
MVPELAEDLWHAYNLIAADDLVAATTVQKEATGGGGGGDSERVRLKLEIRVELVADTVPWAQAVEYDATAAVLRVRGKNVAENEHVRVGSVPKPNPRTLHTSLPLPNLASLPVLVPLVITSQTKYGAAGGAWLHQVGAYHTLELDLQRAFMLTKVLHLNCDPHPASTVQRLLTFPKHSAATISLTIARLRSARCSQVAGKLRLLLRLGGDREPHEAALLLLLLQDCWDAVALDTLRLASDPAASSDVAAVLMQEGLAILCLLGGSVTTDKARVEVSIPRKRGGGLAGYDKVTCNSCLTSTICHGDKIERASVTLPAVPVVSAASFAYARDVDPLSVVARPALACQAMNRFFEQTLQAVLRHVDFGIVRCLILASPGFTKDQFYEFLMIEATRRELRAIIENKNRIILAHSSSGYKHSLKEVLAEPAVLARVKDTKAAKEVKALQDFYSMLTADSARAFYGPGHVEAAHERLAIQTLLITDELFRNANLTERRRWVNLVEAVKADGGHVHVFSSMHVSGEQLRQLTGVAAILRFPLPDLEDMEL